MTELLRIDDKLTRSMPPGWIVVSLEFPRNRRTLVVNPERTRQCLVTSPRTPEWALREIREGRGTAVSEELRDMLPSEGS